VPLCRNGTTESLGAGRPNGFRRQVGRSAVFRPKRTTRGSLSRPDGQTVSAVMLGRPGPVPLSRDGITEPVAAGRADGFCRHGGPLWPCAALQEWHNRACHGGRPTLSAPLWGRGNSGGLDSGGLYGESDTPMHGRRGAILAAKSVRGAVTLLDLQKIGPAKAFASPGHTREEEINR